MPRTTYTFLFPGYRFILNTNLDTSHTRNMDFIPEELPDLWVLHREEIKQYQEKHSQFSTPNNVLPIPPPYTGDLQELLDTEALLSRLVTRRPTKKEANNVADLLREVKSLSAKFWTVRASPDMCYPAITSAVRYAYILGDHLLRCGTDIVPTKLFKRIISIMTGVDKVLEHFTTTDPSKWIGNLPPSYEGLVESRLGLKDQLMTCMEIAKTSCTRKQAC